MGGVWINENQAHFLWKMLLVVNRSECEINGKGGHPNMKMEKLLTHRRHFS